MMRFVAHPDAQSEAAVHSGGVLWRYTAIDKERGNAQRHGEMVAQSAADVRASLRRIGLQALDVRGRPTRARRQWPLMLASIGSDIRSRWHKHCRARRGGARAEIYDSLATMLDAGMPLLESVQTIVESREATPVGAGVRNVTRTRSDMRSMLTEMRERLRDGDSLAQAMSARPGWFDPIDIAMVEAGQHGGMLPAVLASLSARQERSSELGHRVWGALAYPLLVLLIGLGVVVFLSVKTLPDLTKILTDAKIPVPALTSRVMWLGQMLASNWLALLAVVAAGALASLVLPRLLAHRARALHIQPPRLIRRLMVGHLVGGLAELLRSGVPVVDALRVLAPTLRSTRLRDVVSRAAERLEHGEELSAALDDHRWFDAEMRRLLDIGQASGDLDEMLSRIGARYERRGKRAIERLTTLLEPAVLLLLAVMVGTVVMAAILPLLALQEILR